MAPRKDKLKQTIAEDRKRLLLRARKWPFARWCMGAVGLAGLLGGYNLGGGDLPQLLVGGLLGGLAAIGLQRQFAQLENRLGAKLYELASRIEIVEQVDAKDRGAAPNALLDEFALDYCGGHPTWSTEKAAFGTLQVFERSVVFKNLKNRIRMPNSRLNRVTLESVVQVRVKKIPGVALPNSRPIQDKTLAKLYGLVRKRQRYVVFDYTDDSGNQQYIVFWPRGGNPQAAKQVREVVEGTLKRSAKGRTARLQGGAGGQGKTSGPLRAAPEPQGQAVAQSVPRNATSRPNGLQQVSAEVLEAAKRASRGDTDAPLQAAVAQEANAKPCRYCKFSLKDPAVACSLCGAEHHEGCWKANYGCATKDCRGKPIQLDRAPLA
ncbi:MAG: hypothetical protein KGR26_03700 [Cyanobacteria bacterium REEB65]|nr:hypothetical protein [Cyanobacteria bacterium REEB65]